MRVLVLVSLLLSLSFSLHAQTFEELTFIRFHEQQASVRGAAMGGVSHDDPLLNPAALAEMKRPVISFSAMQLEPVNGKGLAHALAAVPYGNFVVAVHYRANANVRGPQALPGAGALQESGETCGLSGCAWQFVPGGMFERVDRRYGVSAAWSEKTLSAGAGLELQELHSSVALGVFHLFHELDTPGELAVMRVSGQKVVPNAGIRWQATPRVALAAAYNGGAAFARVVEACGLGAEAPIHCATVYRKITTSTMRAPSTLRASVSIQPREQLTVAGEVVRRNHGRTSDGRPFFTELDRDVTELHAGAEYRIRNVALRTGWWTDGLDASVDHLTFGAGLDVGRARLELAVDDADEPALRRAVVGVTLR
jgi:hypothetical protein